MWLYGIVFALFKGMKHTSFVFQTYNALFFLALLLWPCYIWADSQFIPISDGSVSLIQRINSLRTQSNSDSFPLLSNTTLTKVAENHCADMVRRLYFSNITPDDLDTSARAMQAGYSLSSLEKEDNADNTFSTSINSGLVVEGISGLVTNFPLPVFDAVDGIWADLLNQNLPFINSEMLELGVSFGVAQVSLNGSQFYVYLASVVIARPSVKSPYVFQCGHVSMYTPVNNVYSPAEFSIKPVVGASILNLQNDTVLAVTDSNGAYCFTVPRYSSVRYGVCGRSYLKTYPVNDTLFFMLDIQADCAK